MLAGNADANTNGGVLFHGHFVTDTWHLVTPRQRRHNPQMDHSAANTLCASFASAKLDHPFGDLPDVWKIGGKMFALVNCAKGLSLKCADAGTAEMLIEMGRAKKAPYLPRGGWILIEWGTMDVDETAERLKTSCDTLRSSLTKKLQAEL